MVSSELPATKRSPYQRRSSFWFKLRARRIAPLLELVEQVFRVHGAVRIVDIGGSELYWNIVPPEFLDRHNVTITVVNLPGSGIPEDHGRFRFLEADACDLRELDDRSFDIAHSNSVVEHVGDWARMAQFAHEVSRVAEKYFVQTPNYWFPVEPHCLTLGFHWLPKPLRVFLVTKFQLGYWPRARSVDEAVRIVERARLLNRSMFAALFSDGRILTERVLALPKSFVAIRD